MSDNKKTYAKGVFIKEMKFNNFTKLAMSGKADEFCEFLQSIKNDKGYFNLDITEKKEEWKKDYSTHDITVNDFKPRPKTQLATDETDDGSTLPF